MIPLCDVTAQFDELSEEITSAIESVARGGRYILGPNVKAFESEIAEFTGCAHAAGVGSGTDALHLALRAIGIGPGDEVITSPFTFIATTEAILMVGATPVFADIDPRTFNIDASQIEAKITPQTRAILPVHIYGQPCDMDTIMALAEKHSLHVVEDCAQAIGAKWKGKTVGSFGDAGCFSFFPSKNLGALGDGGMVTSNSSEVYERVEMLRRHGGRVKYYHEEPPPPPPPPASTVDSTNSRRPFCESNSSGSTTGTSSVSPTPAVTTNCSVRSPASRARLKSPPTVMPLPATRTHRTRTSRRFITSSPCRSKIATRFNRR